MLTSELNAATLSDSGFEKGQHRDLTIKNIIFCHISHLAGTGFRDCHSQHVSVYFVSDGFVANLYFS
jgi:hypothetical protein